MPTHNSDSTLTPSPKNKLVNLFDAVGFVAWIAALYCAWQIAEWWGIGLVAALWLQTGVTALEANVYRMEIWEAFGKFFERYKHKLEP